MKTQSADFLIFTKEEHEYELNKIILFMQRHYLACSEDVLKYISHEDPIKPEHQKEMDRIKSAINYLEWQIKSLL